MELKERVQTFDKHLKIQLIRSDYSFPPPHQPDSLFRPVVGRSGKISGYLDYTVFLGHEMKLPNWVLNNVLVQNTDANLTRIVEDSFRQFGFEVEPQTCEQETTRHFGMEVYYAVIETFRKSEAEQTTSRH